jgi:hypothetical protein
MADRQKFEAVRELLFLELKEDLIQRGTPAAQRERFEEVSLGFADCYGP